MSQAPRLQSSHSLVSMRHSTFAVVALPPTPRTTLRSAFALGGALVTVVSGADRSVVQRQGSAVPVLPPASTARASNTCAPSATVTDAGHAPHAPPSSRHSRRAAASSTSTENAGRESPLRAAGPSAIVSRGAASISQSHTAGELSARLY